MKVTVTSQTRGLGAGLSRLRGHHPSPANTEPDSSIGTPESPPGQQDDSMGASDMRVTGVLSLVTIVLVQADKEQRREIPVIASDRLLTGPIQDGAAAAGQLISDLGMGTSCV